VFKPAWAFRAGPALLLLACLAMSACVPEPVRPTTSPLDVPGGPETAVTPATGYTPEIGVPYYALAYVGPGDDVCIRPFWYSDSYVVGKARSGSCPDWYAVWDGERAVPWLMYVSADSSVAVYKSDNCETAILPVVAGNDATVHYLPDGFMGLDIAGDRGGVLRVLTPQTGAPVFDVTYYLRWSYKPTGRYVAFGNPIPASGTSVRRSDLALMDMADGTVEIFRKGDTRHLWVPIGWLTPDVLVYENALAPGEAQSIDVSTGSALPVETPLPLRLDPLRTARTIPQNIKTGWTGWYDVSPDEKFLAVVSTNPKGIPTVYVGQLDTGAWYEVGPGDCPRWSSEPYGPECGPDPG